MTFNEFAQWEELKTGGLMIGRHICQHPDDVLMFEQVKIKVVLHVLDKIRVAVVLSSIFPIFY